MSYFKSIDSLLVIREDDTIDFEASSSNIHKEIESIGLSLNDDLGMMHAVVRGILLNSNKRVPKKILFSEARKRLGRENDANAFIRDEMLFNIILKNKLYNISTGNNGGVGLSTKKY